MSVKINSSLIRNMLNTDSEKHCSALIPYAKPIILREFSNEHRIVTINGQTFQLRQDWQQNGVAGVIWDSV
ncbi:hypothetical protein WUBG_11548 [Wuchereria bancrofti]|uniref:Uncharacterized protein n=1 Tax=Wuchereria bancrofti TaxID=6293 RepID=J9EKM6_WUCBA|nr:hypothetical protein WUBG_11548 [Wuchereria bancrofti]